MPELSETAATWIAQSPQSVSDKIRALDRAGYPRAEIARRLGKRYQHVRNVLEGDKHRTAAVAPPARAGLDVRSADTGFGGFYRLIVDPDGTVTLPNSVRKALEIEGGGVLVGKLDGKDFTLTDVVSSARRARDLVRRLLSGDDSLADSLIADRRLEAARDSDD